MASNTEPDLYDDVTEVVEQNVAAVDSKVSAVWLEKTLVFLNKDW